MAGQIPDPRAFQSWDDAFQHPLPVVRKLETQLRRNIDENRQKLRSLVGASYRDLLGTAERIIEMDEQMQTVEGNLEDIGRKCNARTVGRMVENHARMQKAKSGEKGERYGAMVQTKVLQNALTAVRRIIKIDGDALQASKLLVLSRLLHKSASENPYAPPLLEELRKKLAVLRKRLLSHVERALVKPSMDRTVRAHTLGAYALVTSSTPKEVVRRFLQLRYEQLDARSESSSAAEILYMLDLYSQTLLDVRDLFPRRFADVLTQLAKTPLLQDDQVRSVFELNLDFYASWIADDVRAFTPWVRHEQPSSSEVAAALASWTKQAQECLVQGLGVCLGDLNDPDAILEIRRKVLSRYMSLSSKLRGDSDAQAVQMLRNAFLTRLSNLVTDVAGSVNVEVGVDDKAASSKLNLWELATSELDLSNGATNFRKTVLQTRHRRSTAIETELQKLDESLQQLSRFWQAAESMRSIKWDDDFDFELDELDEGEALLVTLIRHDPDELQQTLRRATSDALKRIYAKIKSASHATTDPAFLIRMLRESDHRANGLEDRLEPSASTLGDQSLPCELHRRLAASVSDTSVEALIDVLQKWSYAAVTLWDGSPPLPLQPSLGTYQFFMALHRSMSDAGIDLWSPDCVTSLKSAVRDRLEAKLNDHDFDVDRNEALTDGQAKTGEKPDSMEESEATDPADEVAPSPKEHKIQRLFDVLCLQRMLLRPRPTRAGEQPLAALIKRLEQGLELDDVLRERLRKSAGDYWKRTHLLFGLLASDVA